MRSARLGAFAQQSCGDRGQTFLSRRVGSRAGFENAVEANDGHAVLFEKQHGQPVLEHHFFVRRQMNGLRASRLHGETRQHDEKYA